ncbi:hypothetical protein Tco_0864845, partial [Tanacetum coccineum]
MSSVVRRSFEEALTLADESRSKMLLKQKDPMMLEKKVNTTPVDYTVLNQLSQDFETRFVPQTKLSAEQAFWSQNSVNSSNPTISSRPTKVEVPKELTTVSLVTFVTNKQLYDSIKPARIRSKEQCDDLINQVNLKSVEISDLNASLQEKVLKSSKRKVWKPTGKVFANIGYNWRPTSRTFTIVGNVCPLTRITTTAEVTLRKPTALESDTPKPVVTLVYSRKPKKSKTNVPSSKLVSKLIAENEHLKQTYKQLYDSIKPARIRSKEQCDDLINQVNLKSVKISDLNASLQEKVLEITALKDDLRKLKEKALVNNDVTKHTIDPEMLKIDVEPITPKLLNKKTAHSAYIKHTQEEATVLRDLVKHVKSKYPLDHSLEFACRYAKLTQELLTHNRVKLSTSASGSQSSGNTKKDNIRQTPNFDELNAMAFEHSSSGPALHKMTPATISSGLMSNPPPSTPFVPPSRIAPEPAASTGSPSSTTVDQDAPSPSNSQTTPETQSPIIPNDVEEDNHDLDVAHMNNDPYFGIPIPEVPSDQSSSTDSIHTIVHPGHQISEHNSKWTKDHPFENIISELARPVSTRLQLHKHTLFYDYDAFLTAVKPKTYNDALTQSCWIEAMQEELNEFECLGVWELV